MELAVRTTVKYDVLNALSRKWASMKCLFFPQVHLRVRYLDVPGVHVHRPLHLAGRTEPPHLPRDKKGGLQENSFSYKVVKNVSNFCCGEASGGVGDGNFAQTAAENILFLSSFPAATDKKIARLVPISLESAPSFFPFFSAGDYK